jgi:hypothetical protein
MARHAVVVDLRAVVGVPSRKGRFAGRHQDGGDQYCDPGETQPRMKGWHRRTHRGITIHYHESVSSARAHSIALTGTKRMIALDAGLFPDDKLSLRRRKERQRKFFHLAGINCEFEES